MNFMFLFTVEMCPPTHAPCGPRAVAIARDDLPIIIIKTARGEEGGKGKKKKSEQHNCQ
jgi:hypothetical protein